MATASPARWAIGDIAARSGVPPSAIRFYEDRGLVSSERDAAGRRRFHADVLRRLAFIRVAQRVGLSLEEIVAALATLPAGRSPTRKDWARLSARWRPRLDEQIAVLTRLRDDLDDCIGCGCLSLATCSLRNPHDRAARFGSGPRYLYGDPPALGDGSPDEVLLGD